MLTLQDIGFDQWFEPHVDAICHGNQSIARVVAVDRNAYGIRDASGELFAELAGKFLFQVESSLELPCVGDWVSVQYHNDQTAAIIHGVFPRRTFLRRKRAGVEVEHQLIAANIDLAFIVQSCHFDFNINRLHRYLAMAADGGVEPIILLTKTDLISELELQQQITALRQAGITTGVIALSALTGSGFDPFHQLVLPGKTYCLLGSSGVGKTTLINHLLGREDFATQAVSGTGEGSHTTVRRQLIVLDKGALFIDTPGMRELGLLGASEGIDKGFEDIIALATTCRFADCSHTQEAGCAVRAAITNGDLRPERYAQYLKLSKETEHYEMTYLDKRKKDKAFGRLIKTVKKNMKR